MLEELIVDVRLRSRCGFAAYGCAKITQLCDVLSQLCDILAHLGVVFLEHAAAQPRPISDHISDDRQKAQADDINAGSADEGGHRQVFAKDREILDGDFALGHGLGNRKQVQAFGVFAVEGDDSLFVELGVGAYLFDKTFVAR